MIYQQGFTIVELVVTLVILGILSVVALPRFFDQSSYDRYAGVDRLINLGRFAQQQAYARAGDARSVQWVINTQSNELRVEQVDETTSCIQSTQSCALLAAADPNRILSCEPLVSAQRLPYVDALVRYDSLGGLVTDTSLSCDTSLDADNRYVLDLDSDGNDDFCIEALGLAHDQAC